MKPLNLTKRETSDHEISSGMLKNRCLQMEHCGSQQDLSKKHDPSRCQKIKRTSDLLKVS